MKVVMLAQTEYCVWAFGKCLFWRLRKIWVSCNFRKVVAKVWTIFGSLRKGSRIGTCTSSTDVVHIVHHDVWQYWCCTHREPWRVPVPMLYTPCNMTCGSTDVHTVHHDVWQYWCCTHRAPWCVAILMLYTPCTVTCGSTEFFKTRLHIELEVQSRITTVVYKKRTFCFYNIYTSFDPTGSLTVLYMQEQASYISLQISLFHIKIVSFYIFCKPYYKPIGSKHVAISWKQTVFTIKLLC